MIGRKLAETDEEYAKRVVEDGGIIWKCSDCLREGVIQAEHQLAIARRIQFYRDHPHLANTGIPQVTISKADCPYCRKEH